MQAKRAFVVSVNKRRFQKKMKASAASSDTGKEEEDDDDDVGALIYREVQLRKAETVATAAKIRTKTSAATTHHRASTRKRTPVTSQANNLPRLQRKCASKRKRDSSLDRDLPGRKEVVKKRRKYECSASGCTNKAVKGGVCIRHGAKEKRCCQEGCTNKAINGGVCRRHGAKVKRCSSEGEGCTNCECEVEVEMSFVPINLCIYSTTILLQVSKDITMIVKLNFSSTRPDRYR